MNLKPSEKLEMVLDSLSFQKGCDLRQQAVVCNHKWKGSGWRTSDFGGALPVSHKKKKIVITAVIIHSMHYVSAQSLSSLFCLL